MADVQRLVLYIGVLLVAVGTLRAAARAVEPALAAGATIVIGYGLAGRLLPGVVELARSRSAGGRLEQPITYWNAEGALAAVGLALCTRLAGDRSARRLCASRGGGARAARRRRLPLLSRGALAVAVLGLLALVAWAPSTAQLRAAVVALTVGVLAALGTAALPGVASLAGGDTDPRRPDRAGFLLVLAIAAAVARAARPRRAGSAAPWAPRWPRVAIALAAVVAASWSALGELPTEAQLGAGASANRLTTASSATATSTGAPRLRRAPASAPGGFGSSG